MAATATFRRIGDVIRDPHPEPTGPRIKDVEWKIAPENDEESAKAERRLIAKAGQPEINEGVKISNCQVCHGLGYLRQDVPITHPHFGKVRYCPCNKHYAERGASFFRPGD